MSMVPGADGWPVAYEYAVGGRKHRFDMTGRRRRSATSGAFTRRTTITGCRRCRRRRRRWTCTTAPRAGRRRCWTTRRGPRARSSIKGADGQGALSPDQYDRLVSEMETHHQGARNAGRPMLLEGGLDWKPMGFSPSDMEFQKTKAGCGARDRAGLRGAADAAGDPGRRDLRQLPGGAPGVLSPDGAAAGDAGRGVGRGVAVRASGRAGRSEARPRPGAGAGRGARRAVGAGRARPIS